jgi:hypothetical protein
MAGAGCRHRSGRGARSQHVPLPGLPTLRADGAPWSSAWAQGCVQVALALSCLAVKASSHQARRASASAGGSMKGLYPRGASLERASLLSAQGGMGDTHTQCLQGVCRMFAGCLQV